MPPLNRYVGLCAFSSSRLFWENVSLDEVFTAIAGFGLFSVQLKRNLSIWTALLWIPKHLHSRKSIFTRSGRDCQLWFDKREILRWSPICTCPTPGNTARSTNIRLSQMLQIQVRFLWFYFFGLLFVCLERESVLQMQNVLEEIWETSSELVIN